MSKKNIYFYIFVICFVLLLNRAGASDLPYKEDFDDKEVGSSFEDWNHPLGTILRPDSNPEVAIVL